MFSSSHPVSLCHVVPEQRDWGKFKAGRSPPRQRHEASMRGRGCVLRERSAAKVEQGVSPPPHRLAEFGGADFCGNEAKRSGRKNWGNQWPLIFPNHDATRFNIATRSGCDDEQVRRAPIPLLSPARLNKRRGCPSDGHPKGQDPSGLGLSPCSDDSAVPAALALTVFPARIAA